VQQAQAKVEARKLIVEGAVSIVKGAFDGLEESGMRVKPEDKDDLIKKLMIVNCADQGDTSQVMHL
jgi:hypothetical protein